MGFAPQQIDKMSVWQYSAALEGFIRANTPTDGKSLTSAEKAALADWVLSDPAAPRMLSSAVYWFDENGLRLIRRVTFEA